MREKLKTQLYFKSGSKALIYIQVIGGMDYKEGCRLGAKVEVASLLCQISAPWRGRAFLYRFCGPLPEGICFLSSENPTIRPIFLREGCLVAPYLYVLTANAFGIFVGGGAGQIKGFKLLDGSEMIIILRTISYYLWELIRARLYTWCHCKCS